MPNESERQTRKKRIDQKLIHLGWKIVPYQLGLNTSTFSNHAVEEYPTSSGPADYALFVEGKLLGIIEAKKLSVDAQNESEFANFQNLKPKQLQKQIVFAFDPMKKK